MRSVKANGIDLAYVESGSGASLILLHGATADRNQFNVFVPLLGEGIRGIALDQRDSPDSPCDGAAYTSYDHARDIVAAIRALGLERAHVMGTSYGGMVAMTLAIHHPDVVQSLILAATAPRLSDFQSRDQAAERAKCAEALERFMLEAVMSPDSIDNDPELVACVKAAVCLRSQESMARRMAAVAGHDVKADLGKIGAPTLVLQGDEDPMIDVSTATAMAERIPTAILHVLAGSRHGLTFEHRQRTAALVRSFVLTND